MYKLVSTAGLVTMAASLSLSACALPDHITLSGTESLLKMPAAVRLEDPPPPKWHGTIGLGLDFARSAVNTDSIKLLANANYKMKKSLIALDAAYLSTRQNGASTEETTFFNGDYNFDTGEKTYGFGNFRIRKDRINAIDLRTIVGGGLGYRWIKSADTTFNTEAGLTYRREAYTTGGNKSGISGQAGYLYTRRVSKTANFRHDLTYYPKLSNLNDYYAVTNLIFDQALSGSLTLSARILMDYSSTPAPGAQRSTSRYILSIGTKF
ncbi:MAG: DUF481 domain-containing protein [Chthonomonadales bacterium]